MKRREFKGEITVFLSLVFVLLLSFIGGMIQSASIHITKSEKRADTELAVESVFAEYQSKMQEEYGIFAKLDGDETKFSRRLWFYGAKNMKHEIQKIQFLTDENGQAFFEQAVHSMGGEVADGKGVSVLSWEEQEQIVNQRLDDILIETGQSLPTENNPIEVVNNLKQSSLLTIVLENPETISNRYVVLGELPSHRSLAKGTGFATASSKSGVAKKALFAAYLVKHFPSYADNKAENSLFYEAEYLLEGQESDMENLEAVLQKISVIRTGINYAYLLTDQMKQAEAEAAAVALGSILLVPEASQLIKQAILFAWAYGEGICDLRTLVQGKKVPITKTQETWQLSLENLMKLGTEEVFVSIEDTKGISYGDYVRTFLLAEQVEQLCMRALDLMELKLGIRVDACVTAIRVKSTCEMQLGIQDTFLTEYKYQ